MRYFALATAFSLLTFVCGEHHCLGRAQKNKDRSGKTGTQRRLHDRQSGQSVFSSPDSSWDVLPGFTGAGGKPLKMSVELPEFVRVKKLALSKEQLAAIDRLHQESLASMNLDRERILRLQQQLDTVKGHPRSTVIVQDEALPSEVELTIEIARLRYEIRQQRKEAGDKLLRLLSDEQRQQLAEMPPGEATAHPPVDQP